MSGVTVTGDFDALQGVIGAVDLMRSAKWRKGLSKNLVEEAQTQIALGFRSARDPYGRPWKQSRRAGMSGGLTLSNRGRLKNSWARSTARLSVSDKGFTLGTNVIYAKSHQKGLTIRAKNGKALRFKPYRSRKWVVVKSVKMPKRMMVPENTLGPIWTAAFQQATAAYVRATVQP